MIGLIEVHCRGGSFAVRFEFVIVVVVGVVVQRQKRLIFFSSATLIYVIQIDNPHGPYRLLISIGSIHIRKKSTKGDSGTHRNNSGTMTDTNEEHKRIDEDQARIEEKRMREFERRNGVSVNECVRGQIYSQFVFHILSMNE